MVSSTSLTKTLVNGCVTLTEADVADIAKWQVKTVEVLLNGRRMTILADIETTDDSIVIHFADEDAGNLDFSRAIVSLQLIDSQGFAFEGSNNSYSES